MKSVSAAEFRARMSELPNDEVRESEKREVEEKGEKREKRDESGER